LRRRYNTAIEDQSDAAALELLDIGPLCPLFARHPLTILSDIDGTLAPIVSDHNAARVTGRAADALRSLADRGASIGFVTGRPLDFARTMIDVPGASYAANHGLTFFVDGAEATLPEVQRYVDFARKALSEIGALPGITIEDKGPIIALHYRNAPSETEAIAAIEAAIQRSPTARGFTVQHSRKVIELRPPLPLNKGTAAATLLAHIAPAAVVCMGDDITDIDMFRIVRASGIPAAIVAVANDEEAGVLAEADYFVRGVEGVERLLEEILKALP
jgi:trehalose-phosphatase